MWQQKKPSVNRKRKIANTISTSSQRPAASIASPNQTAKEHEEANIQGLLLRLEQDRAQDNRWGRLFRAAETHGFRSFSLQEYVNWSGSQSSQTTDLTEYDGWKPKPQIRGRFNLMEKDSDNSNNQKQFRIRPCVIQAYQVKHGC